MTHGNPERKPNLPARFSVRQLAVGLLVLGALSVGGWFYFGGASPGDHATITMNESGYTPNQVTIKAGQTVVFNNKSQSDRWPASNIHPTHEIYPEFDSGRPILPDQNWSFKFDKAGVWRFHDHLLPDMVGSITVVD